MVPWNYYYYKGSVDFRNQNISCVRSHFLIKNALTRNTELVLYVEDSPKEIPVCISQAPVLKLWGLSHKPKIFLQ